MNRRPRLGFRPRRGYNSGTRLAEFPAPAKLVVYRNGIAFSAQVAHEGAVERPADVREVQADQAQGRRARDLRGPPAQAAARVILERGRPGRTPGARTNTAAGTAALQVS